jgi:hypothetical protein
MATPVDDIESVPVDTGPPPDPETVSQMISIRLTAGMIDRFKAAAKLHGVSHYQTLVKHVLRCWIDENQPIDAPRVPTPEETPRPVRSRKELIAALREAVKHQEDALARGAGKDELQALQEAIDGIKDDLADLENVGDF